MPGDANDLRREYARLQIDLENINAKLRDAVDHLVKCDLVPFSKEDADPELRGAHHLLLQKAAEISDTLDMLQGLLSGDRVRSQDR